MKIDTLLKKRIFQSIVIVLAYLLHDYFRYHRPFSEELSTIDSLTIRATLNYLVSSVPVILALFLLVPHREIIFKLGLNRGFLTALAFGVIATIPMSVGSLIFADYNTDVTTDYVIYGSAVAGFMEEFFFRGFLFGLLFRVVKWGFIPSIIITSIIFGMGHLYQSTDILSALAVFGVTALGSVMFGWVYVEWNYNLWCAIFLHFFMNLWWIVFSLSSTSQGDLLANIFRVSSIAIVIALTIFYKRKNSLDYQITKRTIWVNR